MLFYYRLLIKILYFISLHEIVVLNS